MNTKVLKPEIQEFINSNLESDISNLALKKNPFPEIEWSTIINQIAAKQKAKNKLNTWYNCSNIIYPSKISIEQTSSETTAKYKSNLVNGDCLIDLTGGFGVDDYYFSKKIKSVTHCELNTELSEIVAHNFNQLNIQNIHCIAKDSEVVLKESNKHWDWIYIDPSRRSDVKGKVFLLKDCLPNVPELLDFYFNYSDNLLIKTAPILDITAGISELKNVKEIHIVAVDNEVKELLWIINKGYSNDVKITSVNISNEQNEIFSIFLSQYNASVQFSKPLKYVYEPNSAIMKSGAFDAISNEYNVYKLHPNTHLYTSDNLVSFPGRTFQIDKILAFNKKEIKSNLENTKANITIRNFPDTVDNLRKKWKIKDGGNVYCFFTTDSNNNKIVLICSKCN